MGRQINFFMTSKDEKDFLDYARSTCNLAILPYTSKESVFKPLESLSPPKSQDFWWNLWLVNMDISHKVVTKFIPEQGYFLVDESASDVLEFSRSLPFDDRLNRGRIWAEFYSHFDDNTGQLVKKDQELGKWFERLVRWIRKNFRKEDSLIYIGPCAQELLDSIDFVPEQGWSWLRLIPKKDEKQSRSPQDDKRRG
jgi:hypothetical protein